MKKVIVARMVTPPPYQERQSVICLVGRRGWTKLEVPGIVAKVLKDRVNVCIGGRAKPVVFMFKSLSEEEVVE